MKPARWLVLLPAALPLLLLASCGLSKKDSATAGTSGGQSPFGPGGVPPHLRSGGMEDAGTPVKPGGNQEAQNAEILSKLTHSDADLAWTNPDDPDAEIPEFAQVAPENADNLHWLESEPTAIRQSKKSGKPLLIWFHDQTIGASATVNKELLSRSDFQAWASENTVRLVINARPEGKNPDEKIRREFHNRELKKKYNARGYPTFLVLAPSSGEVIGRYTAYRRGQEDFLWGQIKHGTALAAEKQQAWRASLEKKGYREWSDGKGRTLFAKLTAYKDGELLLTEPDGERARTKEKNLCAEDQEWIKRQKELRGIVER